MALEARSERKLARQQADRERQTEREFELARQQAVLARQPVSER